MGRKAADNSKHRLNNRVSAKTVTLVVRPFVEQFWFNFAVVKGSPGSRPSNTSTAKPAMDTPGHGFTAPRASEAVTAFAVHHRPRRLVDRHILDLPRRQARAAGQESERVFTADWQQHGWLDLDRPKGTADGANMSDHRRIGRVRRGGGRRLCRDGCDGLRIRSERRDHRRRRLKGNSRRAIPFAVEGRPIRGQCA